MLKIFMAFVFLLGFASEIMATLSDDDELPSETKPVATLKRTQEESDPHLELGNQEEANNSLSGETVPKKRKIEPREENIVELYDSGLTYKQMSEALSMPVGTLKDHLRNLRKQGKIANRSGPWSEEKKQTLLRLLDEGKTHDQIAVEMKISLATVDSNIGKLRAKGKLESYQRVWTPESTALLKKLHNEGKSIAELIVALKVTDKQVSNRLSYLRKKGEIDLVESPWTETTIEKLKELYLAGMTKKNIATTMGLRVAQVKDKLSALLRSKELKKQKSRSEILWPQEKVDLLLKMRAEGMSKSQMAPILGVKEYQVGNKVVTLLKHGVIKKLK